MLLLVLAGCFAVRREGTECAAIGIASRVQCGTATSPTGAFIGEVTAAQTTAVLGGLAALATAMAVFFVY